MSEIVLFEDKKECCGCGACMNVCPKEAISMVEDEYGFIYPKIDKTLCVECGACKKVCGYQSLPEKHKPERVYAMAAKDEDMLRQSASGGAFAVIAENILKDGGIVYGAALVQGNDKLSPKHIRIDAVEDLVRLQGSKYVQSDMGMTYQQVRKDIQNGLKVLFSGTPCQIAGLQKFIKKEDKNLVTIEIICHGVPNARLFNDYIKYMEQIRKTPKTVGFLFRDKSKGQDMTSKFLYADGSCKIVSGKTTSYVSLFLKSLTYRSNCYSCPYSTPDRVADITVGDFWGFHEEYPKLDKNIQLSNGKGISCVLVNTELGKKVIESCKNKFIVMDSEFNRVAQHNAQLQRPSKYSPERESVLGSYKIEGYGAVEKYYHKNFKKEILFYTISNLVPKNAKRMVKKAIGNIKRK